MVHSFCGVGKSSAKSSATAGSTGRNPACGPELLRLGGVQEVLERVGLVEMRAGDDDRHRVLDLERLRRVDVLDRLALALDVDRLVLVAEQHVAAALQEHVGGLTARAGTRLDVLGDQLVDEVQTRPAEFLPPSLLAAYGASRFHLADPELSGLGVIDLEPRLQQVVPVLDVLRVALAHDQRNHRTERDALGGVGVPVLGDLVGLDQPGDVGLDREVDDVGGLAVDDGRGTGRPRRRRTW